MKLLTALLLLLATLCIQGQTTTSTATGNPIIPDLLADPSIVEINGTFYCYATTDGYDQGLATSGPPVVWTSKDFVHWSFMGSLFPAAAGQLYWAPSTVTKVKDRYYFYPTINTNIYVATASLPDGPFHLARGNDVFTGPNAPPPLLTTDGPKGTKGIDAEMFIDDDGKAYLFWAQRGAGRLLSNLVSLDTNTITVIPTKRGGYSEGPFVFKRKGIYYYLYTLNGHENYQYAYGYSRVSPLGPYEFPDNDIIATTDSAKGIYGPGHGSVFSVKGTDDYYFTYLEFGRGSTNRQVWVNKLEFNEDGTIKPVVLTHTGVGSLHKGKKEDDNIALGAQATASDTLPDLQVKPIKDPSLQRTETYVPGNALDGSNGTRWMSPATGEPAWFIADLGAVKKIKRTAAYFVKPTAGHAYRLEYSVDGKNWATRGGHQDVRVQSPHTDKISAKARYLKITILSGTPGLWELKVY